MKKSYLFWNLFKKIGSLTFAIVLLLCIAFCSMIGTVIEQDQPIEYYKLNYPENQFYVFDWKFIRLFGLDHIYSNIIFFTFILIFFSSLIFCTFSTQLPVLKYSRRWKFFSESLSLEKKFFSTRHSSNHFVNFIYLLNLKDYYVFHRSRAIYAYKGLIGRLSPIFVHISLILILIGPIISNFTGFSAQEFVPSGEFFHIQNFLRQGTFSYVPNDYIFRINDFFVTYNMDNSIQQFFSTLSLEDYRSKSTKYFDISVNHPLRYRGLTIYQTDWQLRSLRIEIGRNFILEKSLQRLQQQNSSLWVSDLNLDKHVVKIILTNLQDSILIYSETGFLIKETRYGQWNIIYGVPFLIKESMMTTGLQIKSDPGILIIYTGFFLLILNTFLSYVSYSECWAIVENSTSIFGGQTNRAYVSFEDEWMQIFNTYLSMIL